jgi:hypothetical protein
MTRVAAEPQNSREAETEGCAGEGSGFGGECSEEGGEDGAEGATACFCYENK